MVASRYNSLFLHYISKQALKIFNFFNVSVERITLDNLVKQFEDHFIPKTNVAVERHKFFSREQLPNELIQDFVTDLINRSMSCEFEELTTSLVKDILICGANKYTQHIKQKLIQEDQLALDKAINICQFMELSHQRSKQIEVDNSEENENICYVSSQSTDRWSRSQTRNRLDLSQNEDYEDQSQRSISSEHMLGKINEDIQSQSPSRTTKERSQSHRRPYANKGTNSNYKRSRCGQKHM
ncbi:hypothetical protein RN001_007697 [Aquatica leii]|uniref:Uncharacterized protein n=1 Tax=Aquatica leii TaxID=1421715 RepID=A0AAN7PC36_9COLE|nr:hypothetical protein RN001_007697 [Aquatica leii]